MLVKDLFGFLAEKWLKEMDNQSEAKKDLGYAFFLAGAGGMCNGLLKLMRDGKPLSAQKVADKVIVECMAEIARLQVKYAGKLGSGVDIGEFKL